jgi:hypothetical protein
VKTLIAFGILLLAGFLGSVKLFNRIKSKTPFAYLFFSGTFYLFFGLLVGENGFNLISSEILHRLAPVINFSLGWVGFIFGFQLQVRYLRKIPFHWYLTLVVTYFVTFITIFIFSFISIRYIFPTLITRQDIAIGISLILAILISESAISFVAWSSQFFKEYSYETRLSTFIASLDNLFPILFTGIVLSLYQFQPAANRIFLDSLGRGAIDFFIQIFVGAAAGILIHLLLKKGEQRLDMSVVIIGGVLLISGLSLMLHFSPLFVAMVMGAVLANLTRKQADFVKILNPTEKPIYIIYLLFLTINKIEINLMLALMAVMLLLIKFHAKLFVFKSLALYNPNRFHHMSRFAYILLPLSSIAPAILLDLFYAFPHPRSGLVSGTFIVALIVSEIFAPVGIKIAQKRES